jgi:hypothetical protein
MEIRYVISFVFNVLLLSGVITAGVLYYRKAKSYDAIYQRVSGIVDVEAERDRVEAEYAEFSGKHLRRSRELSEDYGAKLLVYHRLTDEVTSLEENLEDISCGLYEPHFDYDTSEEYKVHIDEVRQRQKKMLREKTATVCDKLWEVQGDRKEGKKMVDRMSKLVLRAFNGECDSAMAKVRWNNMQRMIDRIDRAYDAINKMGEPMDICISDDFLNLKLAELRISHEYEEKRQEEKEEQRRIREQMREEEKVRREVEKAQKQAEKDERDYEMALERARSEISGVTGAQLGEMNAQIQALERQLEEAHAQKEMAISRARLTKSGHVYVISNVGSFGDDVIKIGVTRRLDPYERVKELGDASVPFKFDVHAIIYSDDAPSLERKLHEHFAKRRVNLLNTRKEFFRARLEEVERAVSALHGKIEFTKIAEAREYRETVSMRLAAKELKAEEVENVAVAESFPSEL